MSPSTYYNDNIKIFYLFWRQKQAYQDDIFILFEGNISEEKKCVY